MLNQIVQYSEPVTLLGGGAARTAQLHEALTLAPILVAADGGANMALSEGLTPELVIGDFDSVTPETLAAIPADRQIRMAGQDTTDFEKCLTRIAAPFILGLGFMGPRADHALAVWNAMIRHAGQRCLLIGEKDVVFAAPAGIFLPLEVGTRVSLFPMRPVTGTSRGLRWPIDGLNFAPGGLIGTSNQASGPVEMRFSGAGMLIILPRRCLRLAIAALTATPPA